MHPPEQRRDGFALSADPARAQVVIVPAEPGGTASANVAAADAWAPAPAVAADSTAPTPALTEALLLGARSQSGPLKPVETAKGILFHWLG